MWAIVPYKGAPSAKSRLAKFLSLDQRANLARSMLKDVLTALSQTKSLKGIVVSSPSPEVSEFTSFPKVRLYRDKSTSLAGALAEASQFAADELHATSTFVIPADVPMVRSCDIEYAIATHAEVTVIPDSKDVGTNGLVCTPPNAFEFVFDGKSFKPHLEAARKAGLTPVVLRISTFSYDVDTVEDLELVANAAPDSFTGATARRFGLLTSDGRSRN